MHITVLSTFDLYPARDGGQNRYINIWRNFSKAHNITILVYDFRNVGRERRYKIAEHVEVVVPPANTRDASLFYSMLSKTGLWLHDVLCLCEYKFSQEFLNILDTLLASSDVLVAAHPYLAGLAFPRAPDRTARFYESYNVEYDIKRDYFSTAPRSADLENLLHKVFWGERRAISMAHHVSAVSFDDRVRFQELYKTAGSRISVLPNGTNLKKHILVGRQEKASVRSLLDCSHGLVGVFLGSAFGPNVESYKTARLLLHQAGFNGTIILVGSIADAQRHDWPTVGFSELWMGFVDELTKELILGTSDFALHLIFYGAGTNLKIFDYMAAGLPIVANKFGRRGINGENWCLCAENADELSTTLKLLNFDAGTVRARADSAMQIVETEFNWHSIASRFEEILSGI